jgi:predicted alpha/beta-fold hydrolase
MFTHRAQILRDDGEGGEGEEASDVKGDGDGDGDCGEKTEKKNDFENSSKKIDARALATSYLVSHIDDAASARANGYADRGDYYADAATRKAIPHVTRTPLLFVSSADDAFLGEVPLREIEANPRTALVVTEKGGHCAFLDGDEESAWVDRLALEWLSRAVARREVLSKL